MLVVGEGGAGKSVVADNNRINASEAASGRFKDWDPADELGHVHVILVGDQLQLPPVGGTPVYAWSEAIEQHGGMGRFF